MANGSFDRDAANYDAARGFPPGIGERVAQAAADWLAPGARVVTESDRRAPLDLLLPVVHERRYGDTLIRIHTP